MKTAVLDSHALLAYFEKEPGWEDVADLLTKAGREECALLLCRVNWGEVYYATLRAYDEKTADEVIETLAQFPVELVEAERAVTLQAARFKARGGMAYADCFAAGLAKLKAADVVTGDPEFERVEEDVNVHWLSRR